jgi:pimeloyl-ACP methyl ester carboxylesterase
MSSVEVGGLHVVYERVGEGPALVLLHGFTQDARIWRPQLESLADAFSVMALDFPGAGRSDDPPETFGMDDCADLLAHVMGAIGVEEAIIVGLSWGGMVAQEFYRRHPGRVAALVLADTYAGWKGSLPEPMVQERLAACLRDSSLPSDEFVPRYLPGMLGTSASQEVRDELAGIMADFHPLGFAMMARTSADADSRDLLPEIRVPTLLVSGHADTRAPMSVANQLHAAIPGAGHVTNMEAPSRFNEAVREFCLSL